LKIGVCKNGEALQAYAWVEYDGKVINDHQSVTRKFILLNASQGLNSIRQLEKVIRD
jgi:hypothetical protein